MPYRTYIQELLDIDSTLNTNHIHWWLMKYEDEYKKAIRYTVCRKWVKYLHTGEKPFPCVCETRVEDCIFIELYYRLDNLTQLQKKEPYFKEQLLKYHQNKDDDKAILEWLEFNKEVGKSLFIRVSEEGNVQEKVYKATPDIIVNIDKQDFQYVLDFNTIFSTEFYKRDII